MHIWRNLLQQSQAGEEQRKEEKENGGKDPIGGSTKADLFLNASELLRFNHIIFHKD